MERSFFRGTSAEQDDRFQDKNKKLLKTMKFPSIYKNKVDISKVHLPSLKKWITKEVEENLGYDEITSDYIYNLLAESNSPNPKEIQISITGFLESETLQFMEKLWKLLISAQNSIGGIPEELLKEAQIASLKSKEEDERVKQAIDRTKNKIQQSNNFSNGNNNQTSYGLQKKQIFTNTPQEQQEEEEQDNVDPSLDLKASRRNRVDYKEKDKEIEKERDRDREYRDRDRDREYRSRDREYRDRDRDYRDRDYYSSSRRDRDYDRDYRDRDYYSSSRRDRDYYSSSRRDRDYRERDYYGGGRRDRESYSSSSSSSRDGNYRNRDERESYSNRDRSTSRSRNRSASRERSTSRSKESIDYDRGSSLSPNRNTSINFSEYDQPYKPANDIIYEDISNNLKRKTPSPERKDREDYYPKKKRSYYSDEE